MGNAKNLIRLGAVVAVIAVAIGIYFLRPATGSSPQPDAQASPVVAENLPRLLDLGADKCVPCKMMAPILEELKSEFPDQFAVEFIDVWKFPEQAEPYGVRIIPTQIFYSADGTELFRHEGFYSREDILAKWRELGVSITEKDA